MLHVDRLGASSQERTMKVTEKDVIYVADLANLELTEQERVSLAKDLNSILEFVDRLNELDTSDVPPMARYRTAMDQKKPAAKSLPTPCAWTCIKPLFPGKQPCKTLLIPMGLSSKCRRSLKSNQEK